MAAMGQLIRYLPLFFLAASVCFGQAGTAPATVPASEPTALTEPAPVPTPLRILEEIPLPSLHIERSYWRSVAGNQEFYVQTDPGKYTAVDLKGQTHTALDVSLVPATDSMNPSDLFVIDLAQDPRGGVIAPVLWNETPNKTRAGILRFDEHGDYNELIWLDTELIPTHVAEFSSSGDYLVTGYDPYGQVHVALFNFQGKMVIPQVFSYGNTEDVAGKQTAGQADRPSDQSVLKASLIQMASGDDDAVYLFNPASGRKVIRVQPSGKWTEIDLPKPASLEGTLPLAMFVSHSSLYLDEAILDKGQKLEGVSVLKHFALSVYDRYDGTLNATYRMDIAFGATPVSLSPREFYFLKAKVLPGGALSFSLIRAGS
jgi:hypothetical protein